MSDAVEPKPIHPDTEAETDDLVNEFLKRIIEADPELGTLFRAVTVALPVNDPPAPVEPLAAPGVTPVFQAEGDVIDAVIVEDTPAPYEPTADDTVLVRDRDGDRLTGRYAQSECETHGTESGVLLSVNGNGFIFSDPKALVAFAEWLVQRAAKMLAANTEE